MAKQHNLAGWIAEFNQGFLTSEPMQEPVDRAFVTMRIGMFALHIERQFQRALNAIPQGEAVNLLLNECPQLPPDFLVTGSLPQTYRQGFHHAVISMALLNALEKYPAAKAIIDEVTSIDEATVAEATTFPKSEE